MQFIKSNYLLNPTIIISIKETMADIIYIVPSVILLIE